MYSLVRSVSTCSLPLVVLSSSEVQADLESSCLSQDSPDIKADHGQQSQASCDFNYPERMACLTPEESETSSRMLFGNLRPVLTMGF